MFTSLGTRYFQPRIGLGFAFSRPWLDWSRPVANDALSNEPEHGVRINAQIDAVRCPLGPQLHGMFEAQLPRMNVGIDRHGRQFVVPVQAKGGSDKHGSVQTQQDILCCAERFPRLIRRAVSARFMGDDRIALFEPALHDGEIRVVDDKPYRLVPSSEISANDLRTYGSHVS